ncbi:MAG: flagellar hook-length control protein FliK [Clostridia bacterium]|nr:flagellar hook-length control protein FliK [Clostridia bacterium]
MRIDGVFSGQTSINLSGIADILGRLNVGDIIRAQIIDFTTNEVMLKLFDGTTFTASTMTALDAKKGEFLEFSVKGKNESQLFLETVKGNSNLVNSEDAGNEIKKQIASMGIKPSVENLEIAKQIKTHNLPLNKETFNKIAELLLKFKELNAAEATFLESNNIIAKENNITALKTLTEGKLKLGTDIDRVKQMLSGIDDEAVLLEIKNGLTTLKDSKPALSPQLRETVSSGGLLQTKDAMPMQNLKADGLLNALSNEIAKTNNIPLKQIFDKLDFKESLKGFLETQIERNGNNSFKIGDLKEKIIDFLKSNDSVNTKIPLNTIDDISDVFEKAVLKLKEAGNSVSHEKELNINLKERATSREDIKDIIRKEFDKFFVRADSKTLSQDIDIKENYKDISQKLEVIKNVISSSVIPNNYEILNRIDNIQSNVRFLSEISNYNAYLQIPINMGNKNTTGELFILKRDPRKRKIDPENVTMLVSLNTENIGQVDSLIGLNKKNVSINIRVEDDGIFSFIRECHKDLYNALQEKGFKLVDLKYRLIEEQVQVTNVNEIVNKELVGSRVSIDYRL